MEKMILRAIKRYLKRHYPAEMKCIINRAAALKPRLMAKAPDLGGKENSLANNLDMFILFLAFYEASDHRMDGKAVDEIIADLYHRMRFLGGFMNINHRGTLSFLRNSLYKSYRKYAKKVAEKQAKGEWTDTWGMVVNPDAYRGNRLGFLRLLVCAGQECDGAT